MHDGRSDGAPSRLRKPTQASIDESLALRTRWNGAADGRLRAAFAPRFAVSCSRELLEAVGRAVGRATELLVHTHASESRDELDVVRALSGGLDNVEYLAPASAWRRRGCARRTASGSTSANSDCSPSTT